MASLTGLFRRPAIGIWDLVDILVVSVMIYEVLKLIRGTRAVQMALGGGVLTAFTLMMFRSIGIDAAWVALGCREAVLEGFLDLFQVLEQTEIGREFVDALADAREHLQHVRIDLARIGLAGDRECRGETQFPWRL